MKKVFTILLLTLCVCLALSACTQQAQPGSASLTVQIQTAGGMAMENIMVYIYTDDAKTDLFSVGRTDQEGCFRFTGVQSDTYVAVLEGVQTGYAVEAQYAVSGESTRIQLQPKLLEASAIQTEAFSLGSVMCDFTVTDYDGNSYTLSELLKTKKAVVLNFWFIGCGPCAMEFPFMQQAYEQFGDDIEILAINPYDGDNAAVAKYRSDRSLTIPMFKCTEEWMKAFGLRAFPTTVVIDRYGVVTMVHTGMIDKTETFADIFAAFTAEDYRQRLVKHLGEL